MSLRADSSVSSLSSGALHSVSSLHRAVAVLSLQMLLRGREHVVGVGAEEGVAPHLASPLHAFEEEGVLRLASI